MKGDTFEDFDEESAITFLQHNPTGDPNPNASWGSTGDADFAATAMDVKVDGATGNVTTRGKAGPANHGGDMSAVGGTP